VARSDRAGSGAALARDGVRQTALLRPGGGGPGRPSASGGATTTPGWTCCPGRYQAQYIRVVLRTTWRSGPRFATVSTGQRSAGARSGRRPPARGGVGVFVAVMERGCARAAGRPSSAASSWSACDRHAAGCRRARRWPRRRQAPSRCRFTRLVIPASHWTPTSCQRAQAKSRQHYVEVPAFKVGHAQMTAGAGGPGNASWSGTSRAGISETSSRNLRSVRVGDDIQVFSGARRFEYALSTSAPSRVARSRFVRATAAPSITLLTCTGLWLPVVSDYAERLVVRAE